MIHVTPERIVLLLLLALTALSGLLAIVARRRAYALRHSEEQYRMVFEANLQPMWVFDVASLRFLAVNTSAIEHYGYSRDEFLAMGILDIRPRGGCREGGWRISATPAPGCATPESGGTVCAMAESFWRM